MKVATKVIGLLTLAIYLVIPIGGPSLVLPRLVSMVLGLYYSDLVGISLNALAIIACGLLCRSIFRPDVKGDKILIPCCLLLLYFPVHRWISTYVVKNAAWMSLDLFILSLSVFAILGLAWTTLVWLRSEREITPV